MASEDEKEKGALWTRQLEIRDLDLLVVKVEHSRSIEPYLHQREKGDADWATRMAKKVVRKCKR